MENVDSFILHKLALSVAKTSVHTLQDNLPTTWVRADVVVNNGR